jgi:phage baseplate assembly protein W
MSNDKSFLGNGWAFPPTFAKQPLAVGGGGKVALASGEDDIRQSLTILLSTTPGERIMQPAFGCGIKSHVFDTLSTSVVTEIRNLVERAIHGRLDILLEYTVRTTNTRSNMVYPFYLLEGSNVQL